MQLRVLIVDLNNFARYPSIAIGYLAAVLRSSNFHVDVLAPLSTGLTGSTREPRPHILGRYELEFRYRTAVTRNNLIRSIRARYAKRIASKLARSKNRIVAEFERRLDHGFDVVLVFHTGTPFFHKQHAIRVIYILIKFTADAAGLNRGPPCDRTG